MKTPEAPDDPTLHGRTLSNPGASPSHSTFSRPAMPDRACPSPIAELITHDSSPITNPLILHSALCNLHSSNPYCTALFCTVPRNQIFSTTPIYDLLDLSLLCHLCLCHLSFQPHCTALFCTVPPNRIFSPLRQCCVSSAVYFPSVPGAQADLPYTFCTRFSQSTFPTQLSSGQRLTSQIHENEKCIAVHVSPPPARHLALLSAPCFLLPRLGTNQINERLSATLRKSGIIDFSIHLNQRNVASQVLLQRIEKRAIGIRIMKTLSRRTDHADRFARKQHRDRSLRRVQLLCEDLSQFEVFLRTGAH